MSIRRVGVVVLLLVAIAAERFAWFVSRHFLPLYMSDWAGIRGHDATTMFLRFGALSIVGAFVGIGLTRLVRSQILASIALLLAAVGHFAGTLDLGRSAIIVVPAMLVSFGAGMFWPCAYCVAADALATDDDEVTTIRRVLVFALVGQALAAIASALAVPIGMAIWNTPGGITSVWRSIALVTLLGFVFCAATTPVHGANRGDLAKPIDPYRAVPVASSTVTRRGLAFLVAVGVVAAMGAPFVSAIPLHYGRTNGEWVYRVGAGAGALGAVVVALSTRRSTRAPIRLLGGLLLLYGIGVAIFSAMGLSSELALVSLVLVGSSAPLCSTIAPSYAAGLARGRATWLLAVVLAAQTAASTLTAMGVDSNRENLPGFLVGLLGAVVGIVLLVAARRIRTTLGSAP